MPSYSDFVRDDYTRPIPGAVAKLFAIDGTTLIDTAVTGFDGQFTVGFPDDLPGAKCVLQVSFGGASERSTVLVGNPPEYKGATGPANSTYPDLAALKAAITTNLSFVLTTDTGPITYAYVTGDFTDKADDVNVIELNGTPLSTGALVRQGSQSLSYTPPAVAVITRSAEDRLADSIRAHDHGAIGNGSPNPLSARYETLGQAQAAYPGCTIDALTDRGDGVAIEAEINRAKTFYLPGNQGGYLTRCVAQLRHGRYTISRPIKLPNSVTLRGTGSGATIIDAQNFTVPAPLLINAETNTVDMRVEGLSLHGGTHGVNITSDQVNSLHMHDVHMRLQSEACFTADRLLQLAYFDHCVFAQAPYGLYAPGFTTNAVTLLNCGFENLSWSNITLRSAESVNIIGGRFEAGGNAGFATFTGSIAGTTLTVSSPFEGAIRAGGALLAGSGSGASVAVGTSIKQQISGTVGGAGTYEINVAQTVASRAFVNVAATLDLERAGPTAVGCQVSIQGAYFENTHPLLVRDYGSRNGVSFEGCHMTQALDSTAFPTDYRCESDGIVHFGSNDQSERAVFLPVNALVTGQNPKLYGLGNIYSSRAAGSVRFRSRRVDVVGSQIVPAVRFSRSATTQSAMTEGVMSVGLLGFDNATGAVIRFMQRFRFIVYPNAGVLTLEKMNEAATGTPGTAIVDISTAPGATATELIINIAASGLNESTPSSLWWSVEEDGTAMVPSEYIRTSCA